MEEAALAATGASSVMEAAVLGVTRDAGVVDAGVVDAGVVDAEVTKPKSESHHRSPRSLILRQNVVYRPVSLARPIG